MTEEDSRLKLLEEIASQADFLRLVQKRYFKERNKDDLIISKTLEKDLDSLLKKYFGYQLKEETKDKKRK